MSFQSFVRRLLTSKRNKCASLHLTRMSNTYRRLGRERRTSCPIVQDTLSLRTMRTAFATSIAMAFFSAIAAMKALSSMGIDARPAPGSCSSARLRSGIVFSGLAVDMRTVDLDDEAMEAPLEDTGSSPENIAAIVADAKATEISERDSMEITSPWLEPRSCRYLRSSEGSKQAIDDR